MLVEGAMVAKVVTATTRTTVAEAAELMERGRFRHLPVLDGRLLAGIVSERDVRPPSGMRREVVEAFVGRPLTAVMHAPVITVSPDDPIEQAARLLYEHKIGCLPVVCAGELAGIITSSDIFDTFMRITGMLEPSTRIEIATDDLPAVLVAVAEVARGVPAAITSILTERDPSAGTARIVVRFATIQGPRLIRDLRQRGLAVSAPEPPAEG
ncbi:MAG: CBS domain-containing protein [Chloroflexi bacterium]|nr:CBS domain-containing protein [Chloroflexota bacterium]